MICLPLRARAQARLRENGHFLSFPYVCPEPVLVKSSFLYINGEKSAVFTPCTATMRAFGATPARAAGPYKETHLSLF